MDRRQLIQRSAVTPDLEWKMSLVKDTATPSSTAYNAKATRAHTVSRDTGTTSWGATCRRPTARTTKTRCSATPATPRGPPAAAAAICRSRPTGRPSGKPLRRRRDAQLRHLQPAGRARRHVPTRQARRDQGSQDRAGALDLGTVLCLDQQPIANASTSSSRRWRPAASPRRPSRRTIRIPSASTETKTCTDCHLSPGQRQQRDHGATAAAGHQVRRLRRLQCLGRRRRRGQCGTRDRMGRAAGGGGFSYLHQATPIPTGSRSTRKQRSTAYCRKAIRTKPCTAGCVQLRGEYLLRRLKASTACAFTTWPIDRQQGRLTAHHHRARSSPLGQDTSIDSRNATCVVLPTTQPIHPDRNEGELMREVQPIGAALPSGLRLRLRHRRGGRPDPHRRQYALRRRAAQQFPRARADLERRRCA